MKIIAVALALCFVVAVSAISHEELKQIEEARATCRTETGIDDAKLEKRKGDEDPVDIDDDVACYGACIWKKLDLLIPGGSLNMERKRASEGRPPRGDGSPDVYEKCQGIVGTNDCDTVKKLFKCWHENSESFLYV